MTLPPHWFANPWALWLLALLPVLGLLAFWSWRRRRKALARLGSLVALVALATRPAGSAPVLRGLCFFAGVLFLVVGVAGPQWGRDWEQAVATGRDLVVLLDVSRSMLARDVLPSRLGKARQALRELSTTIQRRGGQRLALVVFAARAEVVCPLTHDYDHFRRSLAEQDPADLPPRLRPRAPAVTSGTRMGAGLKAAVKALTSGRGGPGMILMLSDGDDPGKDAEWQEGARAARDHKVPVFVVGLGDPRPKEPVRIPVGDDFVRHPGTGKPVETRLDEKPLEEIARATKGAYLRAGTNDFNLGLLFRDWIEPRAVRADNADRFPGYVQRYPWFLGVALVLFAATLLIGRHGKDRPEADERDQGSGIRSRARSWRPKWTSRRS